MRHINIFLASSIAELAREREQLEIFIRNISDSFEEKHQIKIRPILCENLDPAYVVGRKQEEFNQIIRSCDMVFFIFFTKLGRYTHEEFREAQKQFEACGKPKIYTYFKTLRPDQTMEKSLQEFMDSLDRTWGHYYSMFDHLDTIKLRILLSIKLQELDFADVQIKNGKCHINGIQVMSLDHVAEFANNESLKRLQEEYSCVEKEYQEVLERYRADQTDPAVCCRFAEVAARYQSLTKDIQTLQEDIFSITRNMCQNGVLGKVTLRQKEAYQLFERGELEACMKILDGDTIDREYFSTEKMLEKMAVSNAEKFICEHLTAIDILSTMIDYPQRYAEMVNRYEKILPVVMKYGIETHVFTKYLTCLMNQGRYGQALEYMDDVVRFLKRNSSVITTEELAQLYIAKGDLCAYMTLYIEAYSAYRKAHKLLRKRSDQLELLSAIYEKMTKCVFAKGRECRRSCLSNSNGTMHFKNPFVLLAKWQESVLVHGNMRNRFMYWFFVELLSYRLHPMTIIMRTLQKKHLKTLKKYTQRLLEQDPSQEHLFRQAQLHFHQAEYYEKFSNRRSLDHYLQALAIAKHCRPECDEFIEQCLHSIFMFFWLIYPQDNASIYLEQLFKIRQDRFVTNPDQFFFPLYTTLAMGYCYYLTRKDIESAEAYKTPAEEIIRIFTDRMKELEKINPEVHILLTEQSFMLEIWKLTDYLPVAL